MSSRVGLTFRFPKKAEPYEAALRVAGIEPVRISPDLPRPALASLDGLVITGGTDLNPRLYGEIPHERTERNLDDARDELELRLLKQALKSDLAVLGICRGLQMLNVAHGGSLIQHLTPTRIHRARSPEAHHVSVAAGTRLASIIGAGEHVVNSRHHQAASRVGDGLVVSARAADGVIEGLERPDRHFVIAVQWHPEDRVATHDTDRRLFEAFAEAMVATLG